MSFSQTAGSAFGNFLKLTTISWLAVIFNIITWLIVYFIIRPSSAIAPLHYNIFYGTDLADKGYYIYLIPASGLAIFLANYIIYRMVIKIDRFAGKVLNATSFLAQIIILIAVLFLSRIIVS